MRLLYTSKETGREQRETERKSLGVDWDMRIVFRRRECLALRFFSAYAVFSSCSFIAETHFGKILSESVAKVTRQDVISRVNSRNV